jgi:hypothetical protein
MNRVINVYKKQRSILILTLCILFSISVIPQESCQFVNKSSDADPSSVTLHYRLFYIGRITNVYRSDDFVEFDSVRVLRYSHMFASDQSFWSFSISHYEDTHHSHEDYRFFGMLTNSFICGMFSKTI